MKKVLCLILSIAVVFTLVACGNSNAPASSAAAPESSAAAPESSVAAPESSAAVPATSAQGTLVDLPANMVFATSMSTGTWLAVGTALGELLGKYSPNSAVVTPATSSGSVEDIRLVSYGEAELAFCIVTDLTRDAKYGKGSFEGEVIDNVRFIGGNFPSAIQILVRGDSGITTLKDVAGKKVCTGPAGTYSSQILAWLFESYGMDASAYEEINMGWTDSYEALGDGDLDCIFVVGSYPNSGIVSLATTHDIDVLPLSPEDVAVLKSKDATFYDDVIPAGSYPGVDVDIATASNPTAMIVSAELSDDEVYTITRLIYEHVREYDSYSPLMKFVTLEKVFAGVPREDFHPGALRYFDEIGLES